SQGDSVVTPASIAIIAKSKIRPALIDVVFHKPACRRGDRIVCTAQIRVEVEVAIHQGEARRVNSGRERNCGRGHQEGYSLHRLLTFIRPDFQSRAAPPKPEFSWPKRRRTARCKAWNSPLVYTSPL